MLFIFDYAHMLRIIAANFPQHGGQKPTQKWVVKKLIWDGKRSHIN